MKRVSARIKRLFTNAKFRNLPVMLIIFVLGAVFGSLTTKALTKDSKSNVSGSKGASEQVSTERTKSSQERLQESYDRAKDRIKRAVESKEITQEQADMITAKLDEIYNYKKENQNISDEKVREELRKKRQEWRDWIEQNNTSSRYFIGVI